MNNLFFVVMEMKFKTKSLTWIKGKDGKEYVCFSRDVKESKFFEDLSKEEKELCDDTGKLVFAEKW